MGKKGATAFLLLLSAIFTAGCWDRVEIEDRGFVLAVAVDFPERHEDGHGLSVTFQMVVPGGLGMQGGGSSGTGGSQQKAYMNITAEGDSMAEIVRTVAAQTSRTPYFEHLQMYVVSDEVAKSEQFAHVLDFFMRDHEMRRGSKIMVAKGSARKVLEVEPPNEKIPAVYLDSVAENYRKNAFILKPTRIGDVQERLLDHKSNVVPLVAAGLR